MYRVFAMLGHFQYNFFQTDLNMVFVKKTIRDGEKTRRGGHLDTVRAARTSGCPSMQRVKGGTDFLVVLSRTGDKRNFYHPRTENFLQV